jgi:peptidoglycan/LPS O-acetylase OafA/YrhL
MAGGRALRVRVEDFEDGVLPMICVATGAPADRRYRTRANATASGWVWLALFAGPIGLVLALVVANAMGASTDGIVPFSDEHQDRVHRRRRTFGWSAIAGLGSMVGALALTSARSTYAPLAFVLLLGGALVLLVAGFLWVNTPGSTKATLEGNGRWVVLAPVSTAFGRAYTEQEERRRSARQREAFEDHSW